MAVYCHMSNNLCPGELAEYMGKMDKNWEKISDFCEE